MKREALGPLAWTFPAGLVLAIGTALSWILFAAISRTATPSCELLPRTTWAFAAAAASAAFMLPFTFVKRPWLRMLVAVVAAAVAGGVAAALSIVLFPQFC